MKTDKGLLIGYFNVKLKNDEPDNVQKLNDGIQCVERARIN